MSRELDERVAVEVMGWKRVADKFQDPHDNCLWGKVNSYSTDIGQAWLVVEEMRKRGYGCAIFYHWEVSETNPSCEFDWRDTNGNLHAIEESGGTVPEAICRAALEATND